MACRSCGGADGCECSVVGSGSVDVTGSGTPVTDPFVVSFSIETELDSITVDDATACEDLNDPHVPILTGTGAVFLVPLPCSGNDGDSTIGGNAFAFTFSGSTADADPGDGFLRLNNATYSSVTQIFVDLQETNGTVITAWLDSLDDSSGTPEGRIRLYSRSDPTIWVDFILNTVTTATGYRKLGVTYNASNGTFTVDIGDTILDFTSSGGAVVPTATTTTTGIVELATTAEVVTGTDSTRATTSDGVAAALAVQAEVIILNVGGGGNVVDETTTITTGTNKHVFRMPFAMTLTSVRASVNTVSSSGTPTIDINEEGTTILSTKITIDVSEKTSTTAAIPPVISDASLADDAEISIDIDVAGTGAKGLKVYLIGRRT